MRHARVRASTCTPHRPPSCFVPSLATLWGARQAQAELPISKLMFFRELCERALMILATPGAWRARSLPPTASCAPRSYPDGRPPPPPASLRYVDAADEEALYSAAAAKVGLTRAGRATGAARRAMRPSTQAENRLSSMPIPPRVPPLAAGRSELQRPGSRADSHISATGA
jgi:hypothetical protein